MLQRAGAALSSACSVLECLLARPHPEAGPRTRCARMRQGALLIAPAFAARRRISPSACRHKKLLARRAAIEFLLHFFRATVDARESQSRDRAGSRQAAARVFLHQIFALVTPIFFQVVSANCRARAFPAR